MSTIPWTESSPDLKTIENIWGMMDRMVYFIRKKYETVECMHVAVQEEWECVDSNCNSKLYRNIPKQLLQLIDEK